MNWFTKEAKTMTNEVEAIVADAKAEAYKIITAAHDEADRIMAIAKKDAIKAEKFVRSEFESLVTQGASLLDTAKADAQATYDKLLALKPDVQAALAGHQDMLGQIEAVIASLEKSGLVSTLVKDIGAAAAEAVQAVEPAKPAE